MKKITMHENRLVVPDEPVIPYIEGDGVGKEVSPVMRFVVDSLL